MDRIPPTAASTGNISPELITGVNSQVSAHFPNSKYHEADETQGNIWWSGGSNWGHINQ